MNADEFVFSIDKHVRLAAIEGTESVIRNPPGREPDVGLVKLSEWYNTLSGGEREMVQSAIEAAVTHAVTGFLVVLDGLTAIEDGIDRGALELYYVKGATRVLLNPHDRPPLHEKL